LDRCVSSYIFVSCLVSFILYLCVFVLACVFMAPNEDTLRFRCGGESYTLLANIFEKIFLKHFQLLCSFLGFGLFAPF